MFALPSQLFSCGAPDRSLLRQESVVVAPKLLGMLVAKGDLGLVITEVEAYGGRDDEASHAFKGLSRRNSSMFADGGTLYVYLSYGVHNCINVVTGERGVGQAVLVRSGIIVALTNVSSGAADLRGQVVQGPGRVGKGLGAELSDDGVDLLGAGCWRLLDSRKSLSLEDAPIVCSTRVGISKAKDAPWRFEVGLANLVLGSVR